MLSLTVCVSLALNAVLIQVNENELWHSLIDKQRWMINCYRLISNVKEFLALFSIVARSLLILLMSQ